MAEITWELLRSQIEACRRCGLYAGASHKVPGQGDTASPLMLLGEGPGRQEDEQGLAFVGAAGQLLTRMLAAIGLERDRVYICNCVKCRPPQNRTPLPEEIAACHVHLSMQLWLLRPRVILLLGATAGRAALGDGFRITRDRGKWVERKGVWILPTYHPSYLLRAPEHKREAWEDLQLLRDRLIELGLYADLTRSAPER
ncbi:MAG: uracil-DNA glycosylase [Clostridia bacterium]|nr:uracil-DNA glycosylase [Clostridia bacterium]